jgi:chemosensory pili system protein ChpA (sensor histidine kinase/response regulator)
MNSAIVPAGVDGGQGAAGAAAHEHAVDTGTISWLLPEIVNAFDAATTALRAFRAGAAGVHKRDVDLAPLRVARSQLHQAHGALELGEIAGVTRLTEAIEDLLGLFEDAPERCDAIALDAIIGGCRAIVEYLEDLQAGAPQQPLLLFPSYRDLLTARGAERIHPADLFVVDLGLRLPKSAEGAGLDDEGLRVQRSTFEQALLRYIRNEGDPKALNALSRSVAAIEASVAAKEKQGQSRNRAFWWATRALFEALANGGFDETRALHARIKRVAGRINLQIRKLADGSSAVTERLYTDTLFFVALAAPVTPLVREVQARYRLKGAVPPDYETQRFGRIDPVALRTARDALAAAKVAWSAIVSGDVEQVRAFLKEIGTLVEAVGPIKRRGLAQVAQVIDGIATDLGFEPRVPSAAVGLDVATALLFLEGALERARLLDDAFDQRAAMVAARVEASALGQDGPAAPVDWLDRMSRQAEERLTLTTFAAELQANLRSAEKVLDGFFRDPSDRSVLKDSQKPLAQVSGALALLGHDDAHRAIDHARTAIAGFEDDPRSGDAAAFERLAQSLGAVGFYVEQIKRDKVDATAFRFDASTGRFSAEMAPQPVLASDDHTDSHVEDWAASTALEAPVPEPAAPAVVDTIDAAPLEMAPIEAKTVEAAGSPEEAFAATQVPEQEATLEAEIASRASDAQDRAAQLREHPDDAEAREQLLAAVDDVRRNAMLIDDRELQQEAAALTASLSNDKHEPLGFASAAKLSDRVAELVTRANRAAGLAPASIAPMEPVMPVPSEDNVEAIDAELLEIFLEEAATVLSDAEASMRVLDADPESATATANLRRGFHTLKGSGRMVGLMALGDAAWSIEDTLNGHIADQKPASSDLRALIDYAIRYLADWVEELRVSGRSTRIPDALIESARAVRQKGEVSFPKLAAVPSIEPQAAPIAAEAPEDDFIKTTLVQREPAPQDDNYVATTEVLDIGSELPELEFFGLQPELPATALPTVDASEPIEATSVLHEAEPADNFFELSEVIEATMPVEEGAPEPLGEHDDGIALDFELDEPVDIAAAKPEIEEAPEPTGTVVPFPTPRPPVRTDETRQIGSMTLSLPLFNIYLTEAEDLLRILTQDFAEWRHELDRYVSESAMRAAHSLAGSSATVGLIPAHDLAAAVEDVLQTLWREPLILTEAQVEHLQEAVQSLRRMLHRFAAERMPEPDVATIARLLALRREISGELAAPEVREPDPVEKPALPFEALDFGEPGAESIEATVPDVVEEDRPHVTDEAPTDDPHGFDAITTVGMSETPFDVGAPVDPVAPSDEDSTIERSASIAEEPAAERVHVEPATEPAPWYMAVAEEPVEPAPAAIAPTEAEPGIAEQSFLSEVEQEIVEARRAPAVDVAKTVQDEIDPDLLDVFVAEGDEILPQIGELLRTWQARPADPAPARMLLRHLHTLKGSARMAGAMRLGEVVHDMEARVESAARLHEVPATLLDELLSAHDRSLELFDRLQNPGEPEPAPVEAQTVASVDAPDASAEEATRTPIEETDAVAPRQREAVKQTAQQPAVRVNAETLDRLVNLAGEISISRARIDNEVLQVKGAMSDLNENVERLRTQLREIELQAEFQMQSQMQSQQATGHEREKFDPLEFDRFTRFQELTRMMAESVNDVKTVQQNLQKSLDAAETDLASQRRMTRDLQQDLMSVRMVPFSSIAERLYRVARRASKEVDKRVNLDIRGGSVELDRSVLERMAGPFEHLLRNHIAHGIESREKRRASGKDETGELLVEVRQEGNEVVLTFSDDGAGLDYDRIRAKGRELGMIDDRGIGDAEAAELIFHPGFSTASNVTELAGRGVGLDVVRSEALVLAGRVGVDSERGKGTRFTINLPLTLAITQVVLVSVAGRVYALPSVLVEQVQQLRPQPLADAYRAGHLPWAGEQVPVAFLGALLGIEDSVPVAQRASPVLILRSAGERIAVHVDDVVGNQEVVVKNLGPQLARMTGIAGATVLGSGQIVLILNPVQLAQMSRAVEAQNATAIAPAADGVVAATGTDLKTMSTVMVVDDSLTVRRVTQRLLSREGYQVVLAKDGVDALERLQDFPPDVMLVDIEMPRMDGFDLTRNVRNDDRYRHIPIIMITSRTAEKHREHAAQLGVDAYLGKPYQEDELLGLLTVHVGTKRGHPA